MGEVSEKAIATMLERGSSDLRGSGSSGLSGMLRFTPIIPRVTSLDFKDR